MKLRCDAPFNAIALVKQWEQNFPYDPSYRDQQSQEQANCLLPVAKEDLKKSPGHPNSALRKILRPGNRLERDKNNEIPSNLLRVKNNQFAYSRQEVNRRSAATS